MTDRYTEESDEADLADQSLDGDEEFDVDAELDDPVDVEFDEDAWDADLADLADQHTDAPFDDEE